MVKILDLAAYWQKLANEVPFTAREVQELLKMAEHFQKATAYLADCQAATAEGLPASTKKSARLRLVHLCDSAAKMIDGDSNPIRFPSKPESAQQRCREVVRKHNDQLQLKQPAGLEKTKF